MESALEPFPLLRRAADSLLVLPYDTWNFGDSVAFEGLLAASRALHDSRYLGFAHGWVRSWASSGRPFRRLDCTAPGAAMVDIYRMTGDARVLERALQLADYLVSRPQLESGLFATWAHSPLRYPYGGGHLDLAGVVAIADPPPGAFVDCLHFDPPFLTSLGRAADRPDLVQIGLEQAVTYIDRLQTDDGLFDHFELQGRAETFGHGWGRGQGWALLGLIDVADHVPEGTPSRDRVSASVVDLVEGMIRLQRDDGHWSVDVRAPGSGDEFSTAAFMAIGFARARRLRLVPDIADRVEAAEGRARRAVLDSLDDEGNLPVSAAVMACTTNSHYSRVPTGFVAPWGQGPLALMLAENPVPAEELSR